VPLTVPAHQLPVLALKLHRPQWWDGTALFIGAAAPDLAYPLHRWIGSQSHTALGVVALAVPLTLALTVALRWRIAGSVACQLPDLGVLRLRSYGALTHTASWPRFRITLMSAVVGATSHVLIDGFTHRGRFGAAWLDLDSVSFDLGPAGVRSLPGLLQYAGHSAGSLLSLALLAVVGRRGLLEQWCGSEAVALARSQRPTRTQRLGFWAIVAIPVLAVSAWSAAAGAVMIFELIDALLVGLVVAGSIVVARPHASDGMEPDRSRFQGS